MKKGLMAFVFAILACSAAQAQQSSIYAGGSVGFNSNNYKPKGGDSSKTTNWRFSPEVGYFLSDKQSVGVVLGLGGGDFNNGDEYSNFSVMPYTRHFFHVSDNFSLFTGLYAGYLTENISQDDLLGNRVEYKSSGFNAMLDLGGAFALSDRFTLVGRYGVLGFSSLKDEVDGTEIGTNNSFELGVDSYGPAFSVGLYYTIVK